jgi:ectoine hydroxylase-related dioxygenase (phytanoyl-CoA dioxygenase family)
VIPGFLAPEHCERLKAALAKALDAYAPRARSERSTLDRYLLHDLIARDLEIARLLDDPRLQPLVAPLLGEHWILYAFTSSSIPPGGTNYGRRIHVDSPRHVPNYASNVGLIWALDAFTAESGGTEVLPGSHSSPDAPSQEYFDRNCAQLECPQGSLVVFQARLFHRSGINASNRWRHALTMNACRSYMKQRMDWVRLVPESIAESLGPQGRRLLGYDTRLPSSMDEFFVPEAERLYKPNQG